MSDIDEYHSGSGLANNQQQVVRRGKRERGRAGTTRRVTDEDHMGTTRRVGLTMDEGAAGHEQRKRGGDAGRSRRVAKADKGHTGATGLAV